MSDEATREHECVVVLCTVPSADVGDAIARSLVEAQLAACVNRIGPIRSTYRWDGSVHVDEEHQLVIKTTVEALDRVRAHVLAAHPYEVPELVALEGHVLHAPYGRWLNDAVPAR